MKKIGNKNLHTTFIDLEKMTKFLDNYCGEF